MRNLFITILLYLLLLTCSTACNHDIHWQIRKSTASGKHNYYIPAWGAETSCKTYNQLPTKNRYWSTHYYYKPQK